MVKRERTPDSSDESRQERKPKIKHESKPKLSPSPSSSPRAKAWTGTERQLLLKLVLEKGRGEAFKSIPGRTRNQCEVAWR